MSDQRHHVQEKPRRAKYHVLLLFVLALSLGLTACGKKPDKLDPPPEVDEDTFPKTYPDVKHTDPAPTLDARPDLAPKPPPQPERF